MRSFIEKSGFEFSLYDKRDVIISKKKKKGIYDVIQINTLLFYFGEKQIGSI